MAARQALGRAAPSEDGAEQAPIFGAWKLNHELSGRPQALPSPPGGETRLVESYAVDTITGQLVVTLEMENSRSKGSTRPVRRVYDDVRADR